MSRLLFPLLFLLLCLCISLVFIHAGIDPVSYQHAVESHHSLTPPLDKSQVYWNFGGSTVVTKRQIRLTPASQDKRGWLWNEYPLESPNWEVEFKVEIFSKPHFGGDGFGFWVLGSDQDPSFTKDPEALIGPLFGMKHTFQGFGVLFDIYDNDNRRNNPSVFVIENKAGGVFKYNHDNDFEDDMVTTKPEKVLGHADQDTSRTYAAHKCVADFRNTGKPTRVLIKFLKQILHVYIDTQEGMGWKFCLAVQLQDKYANHHLAFSAATGQVADNHDILDITTRYLADTDKEFDDSTLSRLDDRSHAPSRTWSSLFWFIITATGLGLTLFTAYEYRTFKMLVHDHIDSVRVCQRLNQYVLPHYAIHAALTFFLLLTGNWGCFLFQLPLLIWRAYEFYSKTYLFSPSQIGGAKGHTTGMSTALMTRLVGPMVFYGIAQIYYMYHLLF